MSAAARHTAGTLRTGERMSRHTSWRVGGPADQYYLPADRDDLAAFIQGLDAGTPVFFIGLGSNLLVRDGGIRGVVVATHKALTGMQRCGETRVRVEAGVACSKLAKQCARWSLGPAAFFAGIPGVVGGALAMNAGAFGGETWDHVVSVDVLDRSGAVREYARSDYVTAYRSVQRPGAGEEWFVGATLTFDIDDAAGSDAIRDLLARRKQSQPIGQPSCGSVFRNPPGDFAARLIEAAGLKGFAIGGASVSPRHANFIINDGQASAADIEALILHVRDVVERRHGIRLQTEVRIVGERA